MTPDERIIRKYGNLRDLADLLQSCFSQLSGLGLYSEANAVSHALGGVNAERLFWHDEYIKAKNRAANAQGE